MAVITAAGPATASAGLATAAALATAAVRGTETACYTSELYNNSHMEPRFFI